MRLSMRHRIGLGAEISIKSPKIFKLGFQASEVIRPGLYRVPEILTLGDSRMRTSSI